MLSLGMSAAALAEPPAALAPVGAELAGAAADEAGALGAAAPPQALKARAITAEPRVIRASMNGFIARRNALFAYRPAREVERLLQTHAEVDHVSQHLEVGLHLKVCAGRAAREPRLAVVHDDVGVERVHRPFARHKCVGAGRIE